MSSRAELTHASRRILTPLAFAILPAALVVLVIVPTVGGPTFAYDFHGDLYGAARAILHGHDPYHPGLLARLAAAMQAGRQPVPTFATPVYPAPILVASIPFALLPFTAAGLTFAALGLLAAAAALRLLGVTDWRCYGAALLSWPLLHSLRLGQVNELLLLAVAVAWRWRERIVPAALATAAAVTAKLFLWPLFAYLVLTRRLRTAALAAAAGTLACLAAWPLVGVATIGSYPRLLSNLATVEGPAGVSVQSLGAALGIGRIPATATSLALAALLLLAAYHLSREPGTARHAFALTVIAALVASPLVWPHYLVLLYVPIALLSPQLGPLWLVPLLAWIAPVEQTGGHLLLILPYAAIQLVIALAVVRSAAKVLGARAVWPSPNRPERPGATVRLGPGLESTSSRSYVAAQRPIKGPGQPYYTQAGDRLTPRTANRPT